MGGTVVEVAAITGAVVGAVVGTGAVVAAGAVVAVSCGALVTVAALVAAVVGSSSSVEPGSSSHDAKRKAAATTGITNALRSQGIIVATIHAGVSGGQHLLTLAPVPLRWSQVNVLIP